MSDNLTLIESTGDKLQRGVFYSGILYYIILITFGTIGNVLSLLVIRGVRNTYQFKRTYVFTRNGKIKCHIPESSPQEHIYSNYSAHQDHVFRWENYRGFESVSSNNETPRPTRRFNHSVRYKRRASWGVFTALAVADTIALWINPIRYVILFSSRYDIRVEINNFTCKLHTFLSYASRDCATWVLCLLTLERFLIACFPYKAQLIWKGWKKYLVWLAVNLLLLSKNSLLFIKLNIYSDTKKTLCDMEDKKSRNVFFYLDLTFYSIVPTLMLFILNIGLLKILQRATALHKYTWSDSLATSHMNDNVVHKNCPSTLRQRILRLFLCRKFESSTNSELKSTNKRSRRMDRASKQATRLLIPVSLFHLLTSIPLCVFSVLEDFNQWKRTEDDETRKIIFAIGPLLTMLAASSHGANCFLYFLSSRHFRERLYCLLRISPSKKNVSICNNYAWNCSFCLYKKKHSNIRDHRHNHREIKGDTTETKVNAPSKHWSCGTQQSSKQYGVKCWSHDVIENYSDPLHHYTTSEAPNESMISINDCICHRSPSCYGGSSGQSGVSNTSPDKTVVIQSVNQNNPASSYSMSKIDSLP